MHSVADADGWYEPAAQGTDSDGEPGHLLPSGHGLHAEAPANKPAAQETSVKLLEPRGQANPTGHGAGPAAALQMLPAGHGVDAFVVDAGQKMPAEQGLGVDVEMLHQKPAGHGTSVESLVFRGQ